MVHTREPVRCIVFVLPPSIFAGHAATPCPEGNECLQIEAILRFAVSMFAANGATGWRKVVVIQNESQTTHTHAHTLSTNKRTDDWRWPLFHSLCIMYELFASFSAPDGGMVKLYQLFITPVWGADASALPLVLCMVYNLPA